MTKEFILKAENVLKSIRNCINLDQDQTIIPSYEGE
jgi:hypothetical protein